MIEAVQIGRQFGRHQALRAVSLEVEKGRIHALLGPNAAGKSTLLRVLAGLTEPTSGGVSVLGHEPHLADVRSRIGWIPSGDRSFYLRISGLENLIFFGRLQGLSGRSARERATEMLDAVGLADASDRRAGLYSHGMLKRLAVARALLMEPELLLCDEATHDLDPRGAHDIRELVVDRVRRGATAVWATQRMEELVGFADEVTVLHLGSVRFQGPLEQLTSRAATRRFRMRLRHPGGDSRLEIGRVALDGLGTIESTQEPEVFLVDLARDATLGQAIERLMRAELQIITCSEERSEVETAFLGLTATPGQF